jgi:hypothetical protein
LDKSPLVLAVISNDPHRKTERREHSWHREKIGIAPAALLDVRL